MEDVASRIVDKAMALGCQDAVADVVENWSYQIRFARNEAVISNQWRESNASVFVVHGKRVVASDVRDLSKTDEAVERLVKIAKTSQANPEYAGIAKGPFRDARTRPDPKVLALHEGGKYVEAAGGGALGQGGPIHSPLRPTHFRFADRSGRRPSQCLGGPRGSLAVRQEDREAGRIAAAHPLRRRFRGFDRPEAIRCGRGAHPPEPPRQQRDPEDLPAQHVDREEVQDEDDRQRGPRGTGFPRGLREARGPVAG